jgi:hypothetical protein
MKTQGRSTILTSSVYIFRVLLSPAVGHSNLLLRRSIVAPFLKFNISTMYLYKTVKQKSLKDQLSEFI